LWWKIAIRVCLMSAKPWFPVSWIASTVPCKSSMRVFKAWCRDESMGVPKVRQLSPMISPQMVGLYLNIASSYRMINKTEISCRISSAVVVKSPINFQTNAYIPQSA
jgi:hypothetical protein